MTKVALLATCVLSAVSAAPAHAQQYPSRTVELIVPFAAGGGTDVLARLVSEGLSKRLGQSFVPLNRPGANSNTGTLQVVKAPPDGHTIGMAAIGIAINPSLYRNLPFKPLEDLAPITLVANSPTLLVVTPSLPVNSVKEFLDYVKARPGQLNYASYGAGSSAHMSAELFQHVTGTKIVQVPYNGGGPAAVGVATGSVEMLFGSVLPVLGLVRGQKLRPIAIASDQRSPLLPDVPTFKEQGIDYKSGTWFGLMAPVKTPEPIIATLHKSTVDLLNDPAARNRIVEQGGEVIANTPAEFRAFIKSEMDRFAIVIRSANMQID